MPRLFPSHFNPPETKHMTACGRLLAKVRNWTGSPEDTTCNNCRRSVAWKKATKGK